MGQYTVPKSERSRLLDIRPMDSDPIDSAGARWWRYRVPVVQPLGR